ncbi:MAG: hypothetical protein V1746_05715 [bacterium]
MNEDFTFAVRQDVYSIIAATKILHDAQYNGGIYITKFNVKNLAQDVISSFVRSSYIDEKFGFQEATDRRITEDLMGHAIQTHHTIMSSRLCGQYRDLKKNIEDVLEQHPEMVGMARKPDGRYVKNTIEMQKFNEPVQLKPRRELDSVT